MDSGTLELQIFISLIVVLATAFVALVCDYLKGSNESLRERNIELRVRSEEREYWQSMSEWTRAAQRWPVRTPVIRTQVKHSSPQPEPPPQPPAEPAAVTPPVAPPIIPAQAVVPPPAPVAETPPPPDPAAELAPQTPVDPDPPLRNVEPALPLPPGMHEHSVLVSRLSSQEAFCGVVVSIGINDYATLLESNGREAIAGIMASIESMTAGLLRPGVDFGCRSSEDEFILIFPNEQGADAQRRLASVSEKLWSFQLRSVTKTSVLFCWGAVEVQGETLADSVASASERMHQTKRNRKTIALPAKPRRMAV